MSTSHQPDHKGAAEMNRRIVIVLGVVLVLASLLALAGGCRGQTLLGIPIFVILVALVFAVQWLAYIPAYLRQTEKFYDLLGGGTFVFITFLALLFSHTLDARAWVLAAMVVLWGVRLAGFLVWRVHRFGGDDRFDDIKPRALRFFLAWTLQGLWVAATASAAWIAITSEHRTGFGWVSWLGLALWAFGMVFETVADVQKTRFKLDSQNQGRFISSGLWSVSRHPNYFGEITLWVGVFLTAAPALVGWQWAALLSPVVVTLLLTKVSGVPMLEKKAEKKWGDDPAYRDYVENTPILIPLTKGG